MMRSLIALSALAAMPAFADGLPTMRGVNHIGLTVPDIAAATTFFTDVLGCQAVTEFGPFRDDEGTFMQDLLGVNPRAVINHIGLIRCGTGSNIELFDYDAPDQQTVSPRNSDIGGSHIAFYVDDIQAAAEYLRAQGVQTRMGPVPIDDGPVAGQTILYFSAPWGTQMELISFPNGMAYERDGGSVLWSNTAPNN